MSRHAPQSSRGAESGFDALRQSPEFQGAVEPLEDHEHSNDHFALIYEDPAELVGASVPFIRQGLERGEQCLYVIDGRTEDEASVTETLRAGGIDVDAARTSGALRFTTVADTYLRQEPFQPDEMISFYRDAVEAALEEYEGLRVIAGTSWIDQVDFETFLEYEGRVNALFDETDSMALCHYRRDQHDPSVIRDIIRTHPHLISNGVVCHNFYYTPPDQLFGEEEPSNDVDRMLGTLEDRVRAKATVTEHKRFLQELNEITSHPNRSFEEKLQALFDLGCEWFDLDLGALNRVDPDADLLEVEYISGDHEFYKPGEQFPLSQTYCIAATDIRESASVSDPAAEGYDGLAVYEEFGVESYLGTYIPIEGDTDRTFTFIADGARLESFSAQDRAYLELMGQWVKYELERQQYERELGETVDRLQQSNDRLKQFAYAASHDLQEPLRMVSSYLQLLERNCRDDLDEDAQEYIDFAVNGAHRMREMVDDLLAYSRVEQSGGEFEPVDLRAVIDRVTEELKARIEETDAEITMEALPTVAADVDQVEQLFRNLLSNAIKYNDGTPRIEISATERADHWEFAVSDDGIGIDPAKTDRIFEVFKRLHHDDEYSGTGIGLALCQEIVDNHGGDIWVDSEPGDGSTFYFTLPTVNAD